MGIETSGTWETRNETLKAIDLAALSYIEKGFDWKPRGNCRRLQIASMGFSRAATCDTPNLATAVVAGAVRSIICRQIRPLGARKLKSYPKQSQLRHGRAFDQRPGQNGNVVQRKCDSMSLLRLRKRSW